MRREDEIRGRKYLVTEEVTFYRIYKIIKSVTEKSKIAIKLFVLADVDVHIFTYNYNALSKEKMAEEGEMLLNC